MKQINFRKLYKRVREEDYGSIRMSIISFGKIVCAFGPNKTEKFGEGQKYPDVTYSIVPVQWQYHLSIDLWIVVMNFSWKSKVKKVYEE